MTGEKRRSRACELPSTPGYEDASFFTRLFRRQVGMTAAEYRRKFGGLRSALSRGR